MHHDFDTIRRDLVERLSQAATDRRSAMHVPVVVTSDIGARVMVLREFDRDAYTLRFHTDTRAPKVAAVEADPRMAVLFYDKEAKIQIRAKGIARIERDTPLAQSAWDAGSNFARRCYLGDGPGTASPVPTSGLPQELEGVEPSEEDIVPARENFAILVVTIERLDWLYLAHTGHVRAVFDRSDEAWTGRWVSP
ncbi:pyridoxamine 5'-phosphate oxidase family protein [Erythrobacter sp.]|uniref:pyridoxamine 5'-phosphate oxidase family protein n=1 Tax=Erythrobacter sp. TaxID=1042 RepID=UPI003C795D51